MSGEARAIISQQVFIHLVDGITLRLQPVGKLLSGAKKALSATVGISLLIEGSGKVIEV
jgi:hypothetical protein